jgi:hypothetical protein
MKLKKGITIFATEEARKKWEGKELPKKDKKCSCPACDLQDLNEPPRPKGRGILRLL